MNEQQKKMEDELAKLKQQFEVVKEKGSWATKELDKLAAQMSLRKMKLQPILQLEYSKD